MTATRHFLLAAGGTGGHMLPAYALAGELIARGYAPAVTDPHATAAVLSFLLSPESYQQLVAQSGWSSERYVAWLRGAVLAELAR